MKNIVTKIIIGGAVAISLFLVGWGVGCTNYPPQLPAPTQVLSDKLRGVTVLIDNGTKITSYKAQSATTQQSVLAALKTITEQNAITLDYDSSSPMGSFVKQIGAQKNGQGQKFWQYWVNGTQPMVAADKYMLNGGETVLWTFRVSTF